MVSTSAPAVLRSSMRISPVLSETMMFTFSMPVSIVVSPTSRPSVVELVIMMFMTSSAPVVSDARASKSVSEFALPALVRLFSSRLNCLLPGLPAMSMPLAKLMSRSPELLMLRKSSAPSMPDASSTVVSLPLPSLSSAVTSMISTLEVVKPLKFASRVVRIFSVSVPAPPSILSPGVNVPSPPITTSSLAPPWMLSTSGVSTSVTGVTVMATV